MPGSKRKNSVLTASLQSKNRSKRLKTITSKSDAVAVVSHEAKPIVTPLSDAKLDSISSLQNQQADELSRLLDKYRTLFPNGHLQLLAAIPIKEFWRFFVDGSHQRTGETWANYNYRESGYLVAMSSAFAKMLTHIKLSGAFDLSFIKSLHSNATAKVSGTNYDDYEIDDEDEFNRHEFDNVLESGINIGKINPSKKAIQEIINRIVNGNPLLNITCKKFINGQLEEVRFNSRSDFKSIDMGQLSADLAMSIDLRTSSAIEKENDMTAYRKIADDYFSLIIQNHKLAIAQAKTPMEKLRKIVEFVAECEQSHPYIDANGRTFCTLMLNYLLICNNFPLVIMYNPNMFDFSDVDTLLSEVIKGMKNVFHLIKHERLYHVKTDKVLEVTSLHDLVSFNRSCEILKEYFSFKSHSVSAAEKYSAKLLSASGFFTSENKHEKTRVDEKSDFRMKPFSK